MRLDLFAHVVVLHPRVATVFEDHVFASGIDKEVAVLAADGAIALADFLCTFRGEGFVELDSICYEAAVATAGVSFGRHRT